MTNGILLNRHYLKSPKRAMLLTTILSVVCIIFTDSTEFKIKNRTRLANAPLESKNPFLSFKSDAENKAKHYENKILILDMKLAANNGFLIDLYDFEKPESKSKLLFIDLLYSDSFLFKFAEKENTSSSHLSSKILFHTDLFTADNNKDLNYSNFKIKDFNKNAYWNITDYVFRHLRITPNSSAANELLKHSTFINDINISKDSIGTLSLSRESDDFEFFKRIKNENFESEDFLFDIKNRKLIFGYTGEYKKMNLTELYNKDSIKSQNNIPLNNRNFTYCHYHDTDYLVLNKKRKFHNCFLSYLYLGEDFDLNTAKRNAELNKENKDSEQYSPESVSLAVAPLEIKKMAIFDSLTKFILIPIENYSENNNVKGFNYLSFYTNLIKDHYKKDLVDKEAIIDFYCFINDNGFLKEKDVNSIKNDSGANDDIIFLGKKSLICLSTHPKEYLMRNSLNFFNKQNLILNTISHELSLENLLDELNIDSIEQLILNSKQENLYSHNSANNNSTNTTVNNKSSPYNDNNTTSNPENFVDENFKKGLLDLAKKMQFAFEYNINFYNATKIHKLLEENKENVLLKDNIFEYESSPVILGTSFLMGFDQISFEESNKKIEFYGGKFKDLTLILDDPSAIGMFSNFIFSTLWVLILILIFILVPYYFYRRRKRLLMEKLQYEIIYRKMDDITKEWTK